MQGARRGGLPGRADNLSAIAPVFPTQTAQLIPAYLAADTRTLQDRGRLDTDRLNQAHGRRVARPLAQPLRSEVIPVRCGRICTVLHTDKECWDARRTPVGFCVVPFCFFDHRSQEGGARAYRLLTFS